MGKEVIAAVKVKGDRSLRNKDVVADGTVRFRAYKLSITVKVKRNLILIKLFLCNPKFITVLSIVRHIL